MIKQVALMILFWLAFYLILSDYTGNFSYWNKHASLAVGKVLLFGVVCFFRGYFAKYNKSYGI